MTEETLMSLYKCGECVYFDSQKQMCMCSESDHYGHSIPSWHPSPVQATALPGELVEVELLCFTNEEMLEEETDGNA